MIDKKNIVIHSDSEEISEDHEDQNNLINKKQFEENDEEKPNKKQVEETDAEEKTNKQKVNKTNENFKSIEETDSCDEMPDNLLRKK